MQAGLTIDARDRIGEGPAWDAVGERLLWLDSEAGIVHEAKADGIGGWFESRRWSLGRRIAAAVPRAQGGLVVACGTDIFTLDEFGIIAPFVHLDVDPNLVSLNEAKCDHQGRLWAGTLATDFTTARGALYRIEPTGAVTAMLDGVTISNGLDWSPNGSTFYYIDSATLSVDAFDFDAARGAIGNRRTLVKIKRGDGAPDGMTVDRDGCLWVAVAGAGEVRRYDPYGALLGRIGISTPAVTSCAFGGVDGGELFVTSLGRRMPDVVLTLGLSPVTVEKSPGAPGAGGLFVCRPGPTGSPATPFAG